MMGRGAEAAFGAMWPTVQRDKRSKSMGHPFRDLPIILEESLDEEEKELHVRRTDTRSSSFVLRSVSEQHPSSIHGMDVIAHVAKRVSSPCQLTNGGIAEEQKDHKGNNNCPEKPVLDSDHSCGLVPDTAPRRFRSSRRVLYYRD